MVDRRVVIDARADDQLADDIPAMRIRGDAIDVIALVENGVDEDVFRLDQRHVRDLETGLTDLDLADDFGVFFVGRPHDASWCDHRLAISARISGAVADEAVGIGRQLALFVPAPGALRAPALAGEHCPTNAAAHGEIDVLLPHKFDRDVVGIVRENFGTAVHEAGAFGVGDADDVVEIAVGVRAFDVEVVEVERTGLRSADEIPRPG